MDRFSGKEKRRTKLLSAGILSCQTCFDVEWSQSWYTLAGFYFTVSFWFQPVSRYRYLENDDCSFNDNANAKQLVLV